MYLTMNRFRVKPGREEEFEQVWKGRETKLPEVPGFVAFHLMKGPDRGDHILYASHTMWQSEQHFLEWTKSEAFRVAHAGAGGSRDIYLGPPELELFESLQQIACEDQ